MNDARILPLNEHSLLVSFPDLGLQEAHSRVISLYLYCSQQCNQWLNNQIPAYDSLLLVGTGPDRINLVMDSVKNFLLQEEFREKPPALQPVTIPVCYDPALGNDLLQMAARHNLPVESVVDLHREICYEVYMLGFLPGFAYMGEVSDKIATPRKTAPVPTRAGAVGIAGKQTGIYPVNSPGGWNIVGYTPLKMFRFERESPSLLRTGDRVIFKPVDLETYYGLLNENNGSN